MSPYGMIDALTPWHWLRAALYILTTALALDLLSQVMWRLPVSELLLLLRHALSPRSRSERAARRCSRLLPGSATPVSDVLNARTPTSGLSPRVRLTCWCTHRILASDRGDRADRWARTEYRLDNLETLGWRLVNGFRPSRVGLMGGLLGWCLTAAIVWRFRPQPAVSGAVARACGYLETHGADLRADVPAFIFLIAVAAIVSRTPLIDRIRARDEAAKDANRLLTRLAPELANLARSTRALAEQWSPDGCVLVDALARARTGGEFIWTDLGLEPGRLDRVDGPTPWLDEAHAADAKEYRADRDTVNDLLNKIRADGLAPVCGLMLGRDYDTIHRAGVGISLGRLVSKPTVDDDGIPTFHAKQQFHAARMHGYVSGNDVYRRRRLESSLVHYQSAVDAWLVRTMTQARHLERLAGVLRRRTIGSFPTRLVGATQK